ncbi:MAG: choice-of-anchor tandem repeat GloVer-containing protein [Candidatus Omnitrophota bacterium]|nr:choice-of-anchor tandem repeat GloVer-containing protein [Candidatus Omnitrophota bacterium]
MKTRKILKLALILMFAGCLTAHADEFEVIHGFAGGTEDGKSPNGSLLMDSGTLYGMTSAGGDSDYGTVFKINPDGSVFNLLHEFSGYPHDGRSPQGSLIMDSGTLYGMTKWGGDSALSPRGGTIFKVNPDSTGYNILHDFNGSWGEAGDGRWPSGSLIIDSGTLYGMTAQGGASEDGTVFKINSNGTGYQNLREFVGGADDSGLPFGSLIMDSGKLYGMTNEGGVEEAGTVFSINSDGTGYNLLHDFGVSGCGWEWPDGSLIMDSGTLYGMTFYGGVPDYGTIFSINSDGTGYNILHEFAGGVDDGGWPDGSLIMDSGILYGMTCGGGDSDDGTIFSINSDGTGFNLLHEFGGGADNGRWPFGNLIMDSGTFYGLTTGGGVNGSGTIFSYDLIEYLIRNAANLSPEGFQFGYSAEDIDALVDLYRNGDPGTPLTIGGIDWTYTDDTFTGYDKGDAWMGGDTYYIKLGSGLEGNPEGGGPVPELPPHAAQVLVLALGGVVGWVRRHIK